MTAWRGFEWRIPSITESEFECSAKILCALLPVSTLRKDVENSSSIDDSTTQFPPLMNNEVMSHFCFV